MKSIFQESDSQKYPFEHIQFFWSLIVAILDYWFKNWFHVKVGKSQNILIFRLPNVYCQLVEMNHFIKKIFGVRPHSILLALMENLEIWSVISWTETLYQSTSKVKMIKYSQCCQLYGHIYNEFKSVLSKWKKIILTN